jgi:putative Mn2+ efflux pump MntP
MNILSIFIIAVALGMDAFSVAIGIGAGSRKLDLRPVFRLSFHFGMFQFLMPIIGWAAGRSIASYIGGYDHWLAFGLLAFVGLKMIKESFATEKEGVMLDATRGWTLIILSIATSIDALAVGLSFAFLNIGIYGASSVIGIVCFVMTAAGMFFGHRLGRLFGKRAEIAGGLVLIAIGVKILCDHVC